MEHGFHRTYQRRLRLAHRTTYQRAVTLMQSREARGFDIVQRAGHHPRRLRHQQLRRRLFAGPPPGRAGVTFVEVDLGGWDTHQNNFERVQQLSGTGRRADGPA